MATLDQLLAAANTPSDKFVVLANFLIGEEYTWGDEPWFVTGGAATTDPYDTDCSGVVFGIYRKLGILWKNGATWPRLTANGYYYNTIPVSISDLKTGDIFSFVDSNNHSYHTGVVVREPDGKLYTVEARGHNYGVVKYAIDDPVNGVAHRGGHFRRFSWVNLGVQTPPPAPEPQPLPDYPTLRRGMYNNKYVKILQTKLVAKGYKDPHGKALEVDGDFGPHTLYAVEKFQMKNKDNSGIQLEVDGVVGPKTWGALLR
jgi:hypothetical protein